MLGSPERTETAPYYFTYIDRIKTDNIVHLLETQLHETEEFLRGISEQQSLNAYAPGKWSIREVWNHVNDTERVFVFRALWFARGFAVPLPSFDQDICVGSADADKISWASHINEFRTIRLATISFFRNLPAAAWMRTGIASDNPFTVRALAYIIAGHLVHHSSIVKDRYL